VLAAQAAWAYSLDDWEFAKARVRDTKQEISEIQALIDFLNNQKSADIHSWLQNQLRLCMSNNASGGNVGECQAQVTDEASEMEEQRNADISDQQSSIDIAKFKLAGDEEYLVEVEDALKASGQIQ
jgi:hypothetical protein